MSTMVPIGVLASDICGNFGDATGKYKGEHLQNIIKTYKDHYMFLMNNVSVKTQEMKGETIIELPCDFVMATKVGIINDQGRIATMSIDSKLRMHEPVKTETDLNVALSEAMLGSIEAATYTYYNAYNIGGAFVGELYGYAQSVNTLGYFNVDRENNVLIVSPSIDTNKFNVVLEYKSDGLSDGLALIPTELVNSITFRAKALYCLDHKDSRYGIYQAEHETAYKNAKKLYKFKPIDFYAQIFKQSHRSSPK